MNFSFQSQISTTSGANSTTLVNPFTTIQEQLQSSLYLTTKSKSYNLQLVIISVLLAISFLSVLISLGVRLKRKQFWLFRKIITSNGTLISPHPLILYLLFGGVFLIAMEGYLVFAFFYGKVGSNLTNVMLLRNLIWIPLFLGAWALAWATFLQPMLTRSSGSPPKYDISRYPLIINIFFITVPIILLAVVIPLSLITNSKYNTIFKNTTSLINVIQVAADNGKSSGTKSEGNFSSQITNISALVGGLQLEADALIVIWRKIWIAWVVFTAFFLAIYIFAAITYSQSLNRSIHKLRQRVRSGEPDAFASQLQSLSNTSRALAFTEVSIAGIGIAYIVMSLTLSFKTREVASGGLLAQLVTLGALWIFASLGSISCFAILFRTFTSTSKNQGSSYHSSTVRSIQLKPRFPSPLPPLHFESNSNSNSNSNSTQDAVSRVQLGFQTRVDEAVAVSRRNEREKDGGRIVMESGGSYFV